MCAMLIDSGGGGGGGWHIPPPVQLPVHVGKPHGGRSGSGDPAALQHPSHEQVRAAQRQAEIAQQQAQKAAAAAALAQQKAQEARAKAGNSGSETDQRDAVVAEQDAKLADARSCKASSAADRFEKEAELLDARRDLDRDKKHGVHGKALDKAQHRVDKAQATAKAACETDAQADQYLKWQQAESAAAHAEANETAAAPGTLKAQPGANASDLRWKADQQGRQYRSTVGAEAAADLFGGGATAPAVKGANGTPAQTAGSPLDSLLKVSPFPSLDPKHPLPLQPPVASMGLQTFVVDPQGQAERVGKTLTGIAAGKSVDQVASEQGKTREQIIGAAAQAGIRIEPSQAASGRVQTTTLKQGKTEITYSHDLLRDTVTVDGAYTGSDGKYHELHATLDGSGAVTKTEYDAKTHTTTTHTIDPRAGTRTETVAFPDGRRTETTTPLAGAPIKRELKAGDGFEGIAKKLGIDVEDLAAMNPELLKDPKKNFRVGGEIVVGVPPGVVKAYQADGSMLQTTTLANGGRQIVFVAASGRSTTIKGPPSAQELAEGTIRNGLFKEGKSVAAVAKELGRTPQQLLDALDPGTVEVLPGAGPNSSETRRIYDPKTNQLLIETTDRSGKTQRQVIDGEKSFDVLVPDEKGNNGSQKMKGGAGYMQWLYTQAQDRVTGLQQQIKGLNQQIPDARRMGDLPELLAQRRELEARLGDAQQDAAAALGKANSLQLAKNQEQLAWRAAIADGNVQFTAPGEACDKAQAQLNAVLAAMEDQDRLIGSTLAGIDLAEAAADLGPAKETTRQAEDLLEAKYQQWKETLWTWGPMTEEQIQNCKDQGQPPLLNGKDKYGNDEQKRDEQARKEFKQLVETKGSLPPGIQTDCRDAWLARNRAVADELKAGTNFKSALMASDAATAHALQGGIDRLAGEKRAWVLQNPHRFSGSFPGQQNLDQWQSDARRLTIRQLETGADLKHDLFLLSLSGAQRADPERLKEAEDGYQKDHQQELARLSNQIDDIRYAGVTEMAGEAETFINAWSSKHPELLAQADAQRRAPAGNVRQADLRDEQGDEILAQAPGGVDMKIARQQLNNSRAALQARQGAAVAQMNQDDERIQKDIDNHTFLRDGWAAMFGDTSYDAKGYTRSQVDSAQALDHDLDAGRLSVSEFAKQSDTLIDGYTLQSLRYDQKLQDSNAIWSVVDEAVRATTIAAVGIATTLATGGNVAAGIGASMVVAEVWDGANDLAALSEGRDMYADGHSSMFGFEVKTARDGWSWQDAKATLKDEVIDLGTSAVNIGGVGSGMRLSASLAARAGGREALGLGQRTLIGARAGLRSQVVSGAGTVGVDTLRVGMDGQLGTAQGNARIGDSIVNAGLGVLTAPVTGAVSGALPLKLALPGAGTALQFANDAAGSLGTAQLSALAMDGRGMNKAEVIAASVQVVSGTLTNMAVHPLMERAFSPAAPTGDSSQGRYRIGPNRGGKDVVAGWPVVGADGNEVAVLKSDSSSMMELVHPNSDAPLPPERISELLGEAPLPPGQVPQRKPGRTREVQLGSDVRVAVGPGGIVFKRGGQPMAAAEIADWMEGGTIHGRETQGAATLGRVLGKDGLGISKQRTTGIAVLDLPGPVRQLLTEFIAGNPGLAGTRAAGEPPVAVGILSGDAWRAGTIKANPLHAQHPGRPTPLGSYIPRRAESPGGKAFPRTFDAEKTFFEAAGLALRGHAAQQGIAPADIQGGIRVYVDRSSCDSCLSVGTRFQREFPGVQLRVKSTDHDPLALPAALAAGDVYDKSLLNPQGSRGLQQWTPADASEVLRLTGQDPAALEARGLRVRVYQPDAELAAQGFKPMVVFRGSEVGRAALPNWRDNVQHALGRQTPYDDIAAAIGEHLRGQDVLIVGHSLGGRLAAIASHTSGRDAITFNAAGVNDKVLTAFPPPGGRITAYQLGGDPLTLLQQHTPLPSAPGKPQALRGPRRGSLTVNHLMGPVVDSLRRLTPSGRQIDADLLSQTRLASGDPRLRKLLRGLERADTPESLAAAELIRDGTLKVNCFKRDPLGVDRDGFYVQRADYIGITVPRSWLGRSQRLAGIATHEAVHYLHRDAADPHATDLELLATRAQGAVDPRHWSNRLQDDELRQVLQRPAVATPGDTLSSRAAPVLPPAGATRPQPAPDGPWNLPGRRSPSAPVREPMLNQVHLAGGRLHDVRYSVYPMQWDPDTGLAGNPLRDGLALGPDEEGRVPVHYDTLQEALAAMRGGDDGIVLTPAGAVAPDGRIPAEQIIGKVSVSRDGGAPTLKEIALNEAYDGPLQVALPADYAPDRPLIRDEDGRHIDLLNAAPGAQAMGLTLFPRRAASLDLIHDPARPVTELLPAPPGVFTVNIHGLEGRLGGPSGELLDPAQVAAQIRGHEDYHGQPVLFYSCLAGDGRVPLAQEVASLLDTTVYAATDSVTFVRRAMGRPSARGPQHALYAHSVAVEDAGSSYNGGRLQPPDDKDVRWELPIVGIRERGRTVYEDLAIDGPGRFVRFSPAPQLQAGPVAPGRTLLQPDGTRVVRVQPGDAAARPGPALPGESRATRMARPGGALPGPSAPDPKLLKSLSAAPAGSGELFAVSTADPSSVTPGSGNKGGVRVKRKDTFASFDDAAAAAARLASTPGSQAWVYRIAPDPGQPRPAVRGRTDPSEVVGALRVAADGTVAEAMSLKTAPASGLRVAGSLAAGAAATAAVSLPWLLADWQSAAAPVGIVLAGSAARAGFKTLRFGHARLWHRRDNVLRNTLESKKEFESLVNALEKKGRAEAAKGPAAQPTEFEDALKALRELVPVKRELQRTYRGRVQQCIDRLSSAAQPLGDTMAWKREVSQTVESMANLAGKKASFDLTLHRHVRVMNKLDRPPYFVAKENQAKTKDELIRVRDADKVLRDGDPDNDGPAMDELTDAVHKMSELASFLRPNGSAARIAGDVIYGVTYGVGLGALLDRGLPQGLGASMAVGVLAAANAFDAIRIGGIRFDEVLQRLRGKSASNELSVAESPMFKKLLAEWDDGLSFVGGAGLFGLALKNGLPPDGFKDMLRIIGLPSYTLAGGLQLLESLRRGYNDPSREQRTMFLNGKMAAGLGALGLAATSLFAGGLIEKAQTAANLPAVTPVGPSDLMRGHGPLYRAPINRTVTIDSDHPDTAGSLWAIARSNIDWILTPQQQADLDGAVAAQYEATQRLAEFNGFNVRLMDGKLTNAPGDPDSLLDGWKVNVNMLALTRPPSA